MNDEQWGFVSSLDGMSVSEQVNAASKLAIELVAHAEMLSIVMEKVRHALSADIVSEADGQRLAEMIHMLSGNRARFERLTTPLEE